MRDDVGGGGYGCCTKGEVRKLWVFLIVGVVMGLLIGREDV